MGFLEAGVERIVDQVVNPKVNSVFMPQVEEIVYRVQGIPKPVKKPTSTSTPSVGSTSKSGAVFNSGLFNQPPPFMPGMSFLPPALQNHIQKPPTLADLLPTDLDPVSPESSKESVEDVDSKEGNPSKLDGGTLIKHHEDSMDSQLSGFSDLTSHGSDHDSQKAVQASTTICENVNDDSRLSKVSSNSRLSCESPKPKFSEIAENMEPSEAMAQGADGSVQEGSSIAVASSFNGADTKPSLSSSGPLLHYGDQFSLEEEVATTITNDIHEETSQDSGLRVEPVAETCASEIGSCVQSTSPQDVLLKTCPAEGYPTHQNFEPDEEVSGHVVDNTSLAQSEDSQFSESSDNKLHIDEMKDFNSQSENSHQNYDEHSSLKTLSEDSNKIKAVENVMEASEEARHGFDDSQDAIERPPVSKTPLGLNHLPQLATPSSGNSSNRENPPLPEELARQPSTPPIPPTPPSAATPPAPPTPPAPSTLLTLSTLPAPSTPPAPPTPPAASTPPPPPTTPPPDCASNFEKPLSTPPLPQILSHKEQPPTPPLSTRALHGEILSGDSNTSPPYEEGAIPKTPRWEPRSPGPIDEMHTGISASFPTFEFTAQSDMQQSVSPLPQNNSQQDDESQSGSEDMQLAWSPLSTHGDQDDDEGKHSNENIGNPADKLSLFGVNNSTPEESKEKPSESHKGRSRDGKHKVSDKFDNSDRQRENDRVKDGRSKERRKEDDESQSGSEDMQLAWSPLSTHGDQDDDEGKHSNENIGNPADKLSLFGVNNSTPEESKEKPSESHKGRSRDGKHKVSDKFDNSDRQRENDRVKDGRSKERRKEDDRSHRESSSSSRKHDDKSSKHREKRDRRDSSSKSKHDDKSRSDKDRERKSSSSHHRSDDKKRDDAKDDRDRSSSSRHKSSRSDDRHRHRERDRKNSNSGASSSNRQEDKSHDKTSRSDDKSKSSSKSHSSDRDRRDSDRKERDHKDKEKRSEKEKDRSRKESSRSDDKKREKDRDKEKRDKSANVCRPNNERRSPDPDSNNGSMFGGNHQTSSSSDNVNQVQDSGTNENNKNSGSADSNNKTNDSSQNNSLCADRSTLSFSSNQSASSSSSLPFKKRRLLPENGVSSDCSYGQLILKIKKTRKSSDQGGKRNRKIIAMRRLENKSIRNFESYVQLSPKVLSEVKPPQCHFESPFKYFDSDWASKLEDEAFIAYVQNLEQSQTLSGLSDFSGSDSEEEEILHFDESNISSEPEESNVMLTLSLLSEEQAHKLLEPSMQINKPKLKEKKGKVPRVSNNVSKAKSRTKRRKSSMDDDVELKRHKLNVKEVVQNEQKTRRARKPNKRYSNDEFTSHFDYDALDSSEDGDALVLRVDETCDTKENTDLIKGNLESCYTDPDLAERLSPQQCDQLGEENKVDSDVEKFHVAFEAPKSLSEESKRPAVSWNRDSYNSNSEDEMDSTNNESDLIGTALKNLMMESGLGGPEEGDL